VRSAVLTYTVAQLPAPSPSRPPGQRGSAPRIVIWSGGIRDARRCAGLPGCIL
jgi:hypothetical protein